MISLSGISLALLVTLEGLFPAGVSHYFVGGLLVGLGLSIIYLGTGITAGVTSFFESTLSYVSTIDRFHEPQFRATRDWRIVFTVGIIGGAAIYQIVFGTGIFVTEVQWWRLLVGGVLIGIGTRLGKGCTAGHGLCGIGSLAPTSIANVAVFMVMGIGTAIIVASLGVVP